MKPIFYSFFFANRTKKNRIDKICNQLCDCSDVMTTSLKLAGLSNNRIFYDDLAM